MRSVIRALLWVASVLGLLWAMSASAVTTGNRDIGVYQHKSSGSGSAKTGYKSIGVFQEADVTATAPPRHRVINR